MQELDLTPLEALILERSDDIQITLRRRTLVLVFGVVSAGLLCALAYFGRSWKSVLAVSLLYVAITVWEKVCYANAVLAYKSLIRKLKKGTAARAEEPTE